MNQRSDPNAAWRAYQEAGMRLNGARHAYERARDYGASWEQDLASGRYQDAKRLYEDAEWAYRESKDAYERARQGRRA